MGTYEFLSLKREAMPDITFPIVVVTTAYPGAGAEDVVRDVTEPLEKATSGIPGLKTVTSTSVANFSAMVLEFEMSRPAKEAAADIRDKIGAVKLPEGAQPPQVTAIGFSELPVLQVSLLSPEGMDGETFQKLIREKVIPAVEGLPGVAKVEAQGLFEEQLVVELDPEKAKAYRLDPATVAQILEASALKLPAGDVVAGGQEAKVRVEGRFSDVTALSRLPLPVIPRQEDLLRETLTPMTEGMAAMGDVLQRVARENALLKAQSQILYAREQLLQALLEQRTQLLSLPPDDPRREALMEAIQETTKKLADLEVQYHYLQSQMPSAPPSAAKPAAPASPAALETVPLGEVAAIRLESQATSGIARWNGRPAVTLRISGEPSYGPGEVAQAALGELEKLSEGGQAFQVRVAYNAQAEIQSTLAVMMREVGLGAVVAVIIIFLFLRSARATAVAAVSIPTSIALALLILSRYGISLNIMTLGAMAVATGRVVDDAIVVTENIFRRARRQGYTMELIADAAVEVGRAITASTFTTVAVFFPLGMVRGIVGKVFEPFALTVMWSLAASLLVALTVVPALTYLLYRGEVPEAEEPAERAQRIRKGYQAFLKTLWDRPLLTGGTALLLLAVAGYLGIHLPVAFVPADEEPRIAITARYPASFTLEDVDRNVKDVDDYLLRQEGVVSVQSVAGASGGSSRFQTGPKDDQQATFLVTVASQEMAQTLAQRWREALNRDFSPGRFAVTIYSSWTQTDTIQLVVRGAGPKERAEAALKIRDALKDVSGLEDVRDTLEETRPVVKVAVKSDEAARYGLTAGQILKAVHDALSGVAIPQFELDGRTYTLKVREGGTYRLDQLASMILPGRPEVALRDVADLQEVEEPKAIYRRDGEPFAMVQADVVAQDVGGVLREVDRRVASLSLPPGIRVEDVGITLTIAEGFGDMTRAIAVAIAVVYLIMLVSFGDALIPLAILISLPFAGVGAVFGLALSGLTLSIPALIGILMLVGIVVTNAIVLMDRFHHQHLAGLSVRDALLEASATRLRPILMTALATIGALTPLGLGLGQSSLIGQTVAVVVMGGLVTSTLLSLVLVPLTYELLHRLFGGSR